MPSLLSLDELRREAVPMKGCGRGETSYPPADDQYVCDIAHVDDPSATKDAGAAV
jgi:hypothetical protein